MDKICAKCGKHLQADQGFCVDCGTAWTANAGTSAPVAAQAPSSQQLPPAAAATGSSKGMLVSIVVVALLLALGGGGWLLASRRNAQAAFLVPPVAKSPAPRSAAVEAAPGGSQAAVPAEPAAVAALAATAADSSAAAAASRPCSLVSQADMEQILGTRIVKITSNETTCQYFTDESRSAQIESTWTGGKQAMNEARGYNANPGLFEPVSGIGDEAYMQAAGVLHVIKGDVYVVVNSREYPNEAQTESAIAVKAMEKLK
jgi:hypothetical protein